MPGRRGCTCRRSDHVLISELACRHTPAHTPDTGARTHQGVTVPVAVEHRTAREHNCRYVHCRRCHQAGRRCLVATCGQHNRINRVTVQNLDQTEIGEVSIQRCCGSSPGFLNGVYRELHRDAACGDDAIADPLCKIHVNLVTGRQIRSGLCDPDNRLARTQLFQCVAMIGVALKVERRLIRPVGIGKPGAATELGGLGHTR